MTINETISPDRRARAVEALYATGHGMLLQERYEEASAVFRLMLQAVPTDERAWLGLGCCHEKAGQREVAAELFGAGTIAAEPSVLCNVAHFRVLWDLDRINEADQAYAEALEIATMLQDDDLVNVIEAERRMRP